MTARCAQHMCDLKIMCKLKISRRLRKNRHVTILSLFGGEIIFEVFQPMWSGYLNVTDGQTDGRLTVASPRGKTRETKCWRYYRYRQYLKTDMDHHYMYTPTTHTCSYRPKLNETVRNVLQNEDEHRLLDSADTKYDALITHIWVLNNFAALFTNTEGGVRWCWYDVTSSARKQKINDILAVSSEMSFHSRSLRRPQETPHIVYVFRNANHRPTICL